MAAVKVRGLALALCVAVLSSGCMSMAGFFIGTGLLIACGPMPMSASDCESKPKPLTPLKETTP